MPKGIYKRKTVDPYIRFFDKVKITDNCWIWTAAKDRGGYGQFFLNKTMVKPHRYSWEYFRRKIPDGLCVCHKCDNPPCVNPDHLFLGTMKDDIQDAIKKGRFHQNNQGFKKGHDLNKGEKHYNAKLTKEQVKDIRRKYVPWKYTQEKLAKEYNVSQSRISEILSNKYWKFV